PAPLRVITLSLHDALPISIADWPILNALLNTSSGASWVSVHHGGGVGIGRSIHAGMVVVADGTEAAAAKLQRVLTNDPGTGVMRSEEHTSELQSLAYLVCR